MLMGPCPGMSWPQLATWFPAFLNGTAGALDIAVYHSYNQIVPEPAGKRVLFCNTTVPSGNLSTQRSSSPGGTGWQGAAMAKFAKKSGDSADVPLWLGEFGPHNGGGGGVYVPIPVTESCSRARAIKFYISPISRVDHKAALALAN